jgi:hypothetical protein
MFRKKILLRVLFISALILVFTSAEHFIQKNIQARALSENSSAISSQEIPILLVGGSISYGLGARVEECLQKLVPSKPIHVHELILMTLTSEEIRLRTNELLQHYKPKFFLLMVGLDEWEAGVETIKKTERDLSMDQLFYQQKYHQLAQLVGKKLDSEEGKDFSDLFFFQFDNSDAIRRSDFQKTLTDIIQTNLTKTMDARDGTNGESPKLLRLGFLDARMSINQSISDFMAFGIRKKINYLFLPFHELKLAFWYILHKGSALNCSNLVEDPKNNRQSNLFLFCLASTGKNRSAQFTPFSYLFRRKELMRLNNMKLVQEINHPRMASLYGPLHLLGEAESRPPKPYRYLKDANFFDSTAQIARISREHKVRLILLQYPNKNLQRISLAGSRFQIPVIGNEKLFTEKIERDGYATYLVDQIKGTGHLTDVGKALYGEYIAEELSKFLEGENAAIRGH